MRWPEHYTVRQGRHDSKRAWVYVGAPSAADQAKQLESDGYERVGYRQVAWGVLAIEYRRVPGDTYWYSPESQQIHRAVCRAWERAIPSYRSRARQRLYGAMHGEFFAHYHSEYMPSTADLLAGSVRPEETVAVLIARLRELPAQTRLSSIASADTPAAREIVASVIESIESFTHKK